MLSALTGLTGQGSCLSATLAWSRRAGSMLLLANRDVAFAKVDTCKCHMMMMMMMYVQLLGYAKDTKEMHACIALYIDDCNDPQTSGTDTLPYSHECMCSNFSFTAVQTSTHHSLALALVKNVYLPDLILGRNIYEIDRE
jgi:hypothetical protein